MSEQLNLFQTTTSTAFPNDYSSGSISGSSYYIYDAEKEAFRSENLSLKEQLRASNKTNESLIEVLKLLVKS